MSSASMARVLVQVAGGTELVRLSLEAFSIPSATTLLVDATGFDGFPALAALEDCAVTPHLVKSHSVQHSGFYYKVVILWGIFIGSL